MVEIPGDLFCRSGRVGKTGLRGRVIANGIRIKSPSYVVFRFSHVRYRRVYGTGCEDAESYMYNAANDRLFQLFLRHIHGGPVGRGYSVICHPPDRRDRYAPLDFEISFKRY